MASVLARELNDGEQGFIGLGTGGRSFTMTVGVPSVAIELARRLYNCDFVAQYGALLEPQLGDTPMSFSDRNLLTWPARAHIPVEFCLEMFHRGKIDVGFISGAQVDRRGNVNSVCIGPHDHPRVRLTGAIAQTDHAAYAGRTVILMPQERRTFVDQVDYVSALGYPGKSRTDRAGLPGGGPALVITDMAVFDFDDNGEMRLRSIHPGCDSSSIQANTGFELVIAEEVSTTVTPTDEELKLIREDIDTNGVFLRGTIDQYAPLAIN
jgi:glutaconate CoA-transferase, subunit B